jgi:hypothetical protein
MSFQTTETIQRLWETFLRDQLASLPPEQRRAYEQQFEQRFGELLQKAANGTGRDGFLDLIGFGDKGPVEFDNVSYPYVQPDFDDAVVPSQLHAAAELYYIYQHERMKIFQVVDVLLQLFRLGKMRIQRGPGAHGLYLLQKWTPLRYALNDRMVAYRRAFNYGTAQAPTGAIVNRNFHRQLVGFMVAVGQYFRDLLIGEVIRGGGAAYRPRPALRARPFHLRQHFRALDGDGPLSEDGAATAGRAGHQEGFRCEHQMGCCGNRVEPSSGWRC